MKIELGDVARDSITGFEGVVVARHEYQYGCVRFSVQPKALHDGKPVDAQVFDEPQLVLVASSRHQEYAAAAGPRPDPPLRATPSRR